MSNQAPAGWYPQADGRQRYWDGTRWTEHTATTTQAPAPPPPKKGRVGLIVLGAGGAVALVSILVAAAVGSGKPSPYPTPSPTHSALTGDVAIAACETQVEKQLKSQHADHYSDEVATVKGGIWTVTGTVYATNSFNAVVPGPYTCTVTPRGGGNIYVQVTSLG